ncbi:hypothetical protein HJG60_011913 [Phyllostomus discolor]|uniref:Uncharacterized protein n=1 Tax=Phyllostomus discolor TaxID=89673 RepID=A0A833ZL01_9CHIR|nr:hypothetical protein HJG60_011913 [Phyllostomus discolor]
MPPHCLHQLRPPRLSLSGAPAHIFPGTISSPEFFQIEPILLGFQRPNSTFEIRRQVMHPAFLKDTGDFQLWRNEEVDKYSLQKKTTIKPDNSVKNSYFQGSGNWPKANDKMSITCKKLWSFR